MSQSQGSIEQMYLFGDQPVTRQEKLKCVTRELAMRRRVYARQVQIGKMNPQTAAYEIKVMEAVVEDYKQP